MCACFLANNSTLTLDGIHIPFYMWLWIETISFCGCPRVGRHALGHAIGFAMSKLLPVLFSFLYQKFLLDSSLPRRFYLPQEQHWKGGKSSTLPPGWCSGPVFDLLLYMTMGSRKRTIEQFCCHLFMSVAFLYQDLSWIYKIFFELHTKKSLDQATPPCPVNV